jgi:hypothetical protein
LGASKNKHSLIGVSDDDLLVLSSRGWSEPCKDTLSRLDFLDHPPTFSHRFDPYPIPYRHNIPQTRAALQPAAQVAGE